MWKVSFSVRLQALLQADYKSMLKDFSNTVYLINTHAYAYTCCPSRQWTFAWFFGPVCSHEIARCRFSTPPRGNLVIFGEFFFKSRLFFKCCTRWVPTPALSFTSFRGEMYSLSSQVDTIFVKQLAYSNTWFIFNVSSSCTAGGCSDLLQRLVGITTSLWPFQLLRNRTLSIQSRCSWTFRSSKLFRFWWSRSQMCVFRIALIGRWLPSGPETRKGCRSS